MFNQTVQQVSLFVNALENLKLISDRIGADSSLSAALATSAGSAGRSDLSTGDFDNLKAAIDCIASLLDSNTTGFTAPSVNAATVRLPFYTLI
jgi:hypothetical protein